jgi:hypothetical protein
MAENDWRGSGVIAKPEAATLSRDETPLRE